MSCTPKGWACERESRMGVGPRSSCEPADEEPATVACNPAAWQRASALTALAALASTRASSSPAAKLTATEQRGVESPPFFLIVGVRVKEPSRPWGAKPSCVLVGVFVSWAVRTADRTEPRPQSTSTSLTLQPVHGTPPAQAPAMQAKATLRLA